MYIYKITNSINGKIYIGQTIKSPEKSKSYYGSGSKITGEIYVYGKENFSKEILQECSNKEELDIYEEYWIELFDSTNPNIGYNCRSGGNKAKYNNEFKDKMSKVQSGKLNNFYGKKHSDDSIKKMIEAKIGNKNYIFGKHHNDSTKSKLSKALTGIKRDKNTIDKMKTSAKNRVYPETECPFCGKIGKNNMTRYHFDNCKNK